MGGCIDACVRAEARACWAGQPPISAAPAACVQVDWRMLGVHFGRSYEAVSYKYSYVKNTGRTGEPGASPALPPWDLACPPACWP